MPAIICPKQLPEISITVQQVIVVSFFITFPLARWTAQASWFVSAVVISCLVAASMARTDLGTRCAVAVDRRGKLPLESARLGPGSLPCYKAWTSPARRTLLGTNGRFDITVIFGKTGKTVGVRLFSPA